MNYNTRTVPHNMLIYDPASFSRLSKTCHKKCIPPKYHEGDLSKGEAICVDRCVGKFMDVHDRIGKKLTSMYTQDQAAAAAVQQQGRR